MSPTVSSRRGDSNALAGTQDGAITYTVSGSPSEASSIQCTPSEPSTLATSCGSQTIAVVPCGSTARANCAGVSLEDSTCMCASMNPGTSHLPRASIRSPPSKDPMPATIPSAIATSPGTHSRVCARNTCAPSITVSGGSSPRATAIRRARARPFTRVTPWAPGA